MATNPLSSLTATNSAELADAVFRQKEQRRCSLAALPVEEKYRHFLQLQRMVFETLRAAGRPCPEVWPVTKSKHGDAIQEGLDDLSAGRVRPADEVLAELRQRLR